MTFNNFNKVITHDGTFHADEVIAIAMLYHCEFEFKLMIRSRDTKIIEEGLNDPKTIVLDVGGVFNPELNNFDHHQDMSLPSAAGMIWEHFKDYICRPVDAQTFFGQFIKSIDAIDTNRDNIYSVWDVLPKGFRNTSNILSGFNRNVMDAEEQDRQFFKAVQFAQTIIENERYLAVEKGKSEKLYESREILKNNVAVFEQFNTIWKEKGDHQFAVLPHSIGWQIQSKDTSVAIVPERAAEADGFIFRHSSGFMATFKEKVQAVTFAEKI